MLLAAKSVDIDMSRDGESNTCDGRRGMEGLEGGTAGVASDCSLCLNNAVSEMKPYKLMHGLTPRHWEKGYLYGLKG